MMLSKQDPQRADLIQGHELIQGAFFILIWSAILCNNSYVLAYLACSFGLTSFP